MESTLFTWISSLGFSPVFWHGVGLGGGASRGAHPAKCIHCIATQEGSWYDAVCLVL